MARIVVIGGGVGGLTSGMLLARDGHDVTVLERDAASPPETADGAWNGWDRRGVYQFRMVHLFAPRFRALLESELPDVVAEAEALGALRYNPIRLVPDEMTATIDTGVEMVSLFLGGSDTHLEHKHRLTEAEAITRIESGVRHAKERGARVVSFMPEDGSRAPLERLIKMFRTAEGAGADYVGLADTCGDKR